MRHKLCTVLFVFQLGSGDPKCHKYPLLPITPISLTVHTSGVIMFGALVILAPGTPFECTLVP